MPTSIFQIVDVNIPESLQKRKEKQRIGRNANEFESHRQKQEKWKENKEGNLKHDDEWQTAPPSASDPASAPVFKLTSRL